MNKALQSLGHFLKHIAVYVAGGFVKIFGSDVAHTFAVGAESLMHTALGQIAWLAVQEVQGLASGSEKKSAAFAKIVAAAKAGGFSVTDSLINMLIEIAVQKLKGSFGPQSEVLEEAAA